MDPLQLVELLRGHRTYIQTHNFQIRMRLPVPLAYSIF